MNTPPLDVIHARWMEIERRQKIEQECKHCPHLAQENAELIAALKGAQFIVHGSWCVGGCIRECQELKRLLERASE